MKTQSNIYTSLTIDIPTINNFMIEKFVHPSSISDKEIRWYDKSGLLHSFNGFPSLIKKREREYFIQWHKHGVEIKTHIVKLKIQSEIIAEKIFSRKFQERAKKK